MITFGGGESLPSVKQGLFIIFIQQLRLFIILFSIFGEDQPLSNERIIQILYPAGSPDAREVLFG